MPRAHTGVLLCLLVVPPSAAAQPARVNRAMDSGPLRFEVNRGQTDSRVRFLARGHGYRVFLTPADAVFSLGDLTLRQHLVGADAPRSITGVQPLASRSHYFKGRDRRQWITDVPTFARVRYEAVYPGIDLVYYGTAKDLEYDFVVAPGADPRAIRVQFTGADRIRVDGNGDLVLRVRGREIRQRRPVAFQEDADGRREIAARHVLHGRGEIGFDIGEYDRSQLLTIDPVLVY